MGSPVEFLTLRQAAERSGIAPFTLARWADQGRIPFSIGSDGQRLFRREDLEAAGLRLDETPDDADE